MLRLTFGGPEQQLRRLLCVGAHSDDIEIGCGGTVLKLAAEYPDLEVCWVVFSASPVRVEEAQASAAAFLQGVRSKQVIIHRFRDGYFPFNGAEIKDRFEELKAFTPDLVLTHYRDDLHQDHRLISSLTWNTFRNHLVLEYEIPKYDGDLGAPNFFVQLDRETCDRKVDYILDSFKSQASKQWFDRETFMALLRLRGVEANAPGRYAEAFYQRKAVF